MEKPKIVILGGGYGGLVASRKLEKMLKNDEALVTLVNKHDYHYIATQLHRTGAGTAVDNKIIMNIPNLLKTNKVSFKKGTVEFIDKQKQEVLLENGDKLSYDYLLIALGFDVNTFGIPGIEEYALKIRSFRTTKAIYHHILNQFESYQSDKDPARLAFTVAGAGFTGIELVGELIEAIPALCKKYDIPVNLTRIINIEASENVLPGFDQEAIEFTTKYVKKHGVELMTSTRILEYNATDIKLDNGTSIPSKTLIWSGGVRGNKLLESLDFKLNRGRIEVDQYLRVVGTENIYCIGDSAYFPKSENSCLPPTAQVAIQQAEACAPNIVAALRGESQKEFEYHHKGTVASIGTTAAVGKVFGFRISGLFAAFMKQVIEARYLFVLGGPSLVLKQFSKTGKPYLQAASVQESK
ncbi:NAD(P)/FAD-dependent oxidoreductase [Bacillus massilinigeriensis]|uniref:NAD(P)/FAD-dependent oxidoreductase n=1 Tax=Bacillus mediterraneensis TaxID=1805474 RepID=UPI0008F7FE6F|nr:NAD(P)/FAD-dependent oxidoreductase [Bacillus mediterraneensis]